MRALFVAAFAALLLAPAVEGHFYLRHADAPAARTGPGDGFVFLNGTATWRVLSPAFEVFVGEGASLPIPAGTIADGTWTVRADPLACGPGGGGIAWSLGGRGHGAATTACGPVTYAFNWAPLPPFSDGTIAVYGPGTARLDTREAQEPTFYQGATPYYSVDVEDDTSPDYELLAGNSFAASERSTPMSDDDGDGIPDRGDPDAWPTPWLNDWAARHGLPPWVPSVPRAELLLEDALREVARAYPETAPHLGERVEVAPPLLLARSPHVSTFRVHNQDGSAAVMALREHAPTVVHRTFRDVLLDVPRIFEVDAAATRALLPPGWQVAAWVGPQGGRVLYQTDAYHDVFPGQAIDLPLVATAVEPGLVAWDVTVLYGPAAPERRYAFPPQEVVP